ncbi:MAG: cobalamin B12-binding domain-containing protein [Promethearchaeota archaeon]
MTEILEKITQTIIELEIDDIQDLIKQALGAGIDPQEVMGAATRGMDEVGRLYEQKEYYLTELVLAGETMKEAFEVLGPALKANVGEAGDNSIIILATVKGDQHDIGKNILHSLLMSKGYTIHDMGMDVPADVIVAKVKETGAQILALSTLLTMTVEQIKTIHEALVAAGLRDKIKMIVGGAPLNMELAKKLGADSYADDATGGVKEIESLLA